MIKTKAFVFEVPQVGLLCVEGPAAKKFLQGQLSCHLDEITEHTFNMGAHCNPQGRIISFFRIFLWQQKYYLHMSKDMLVIALNALKKYAVFYQVKLTDASSEFNTYCTSENFLALASPEKNNTTCSNDENCILRMDDYFLIFGKTNPQISGDNIWEYLQIKAGIPQIHPQTSAQFLPHELNLQLTGAIHFGKGCYTGQEIIARMHYRGQLKKHMYHISTQTLTLTPGMEVAEKFIVVESYTDKNNLSHALIIAKPEDLDNFPEFMQHALPYSL